MHIPYHKSSVLKTNVLPLLLVIHIITQFMTSVSLLAMISASLYLCFIALCSLQYIFTHISKILLCHCKFPVSLQQVSPSVMVASPWLGVKRNQSLTFHYMVIKAPSVVKCLPAAAGPLLKWMQYVPDLNKASGTSASRTNEVLLVPRKARQPCHLTPSDLVISVISKLTFSSLTPHYRADNKVVLLVLSC